jgi:hypothetical protein
MADPAPLQNGIQIVKKDGTPTDFFIRWARQNIRNGISAAEAQALINLWAMAREINAGVGLTGGGDLSADITINLEDTAVTPNTYGDASNIPQISVDQQGRITGVVDIPAGGGGAAPEFVMVYKNTGQDFAINTWVNTTLDGFVYNGITGASITAGILNLPAGEYIIEGNAQIIRSNSCRIRLYDQTGAAVLCSGQCVWSGNATGTGVGAWAYPSLFGTFTLTAASDVQVQHFIQSSTGSFTDNGFLGDIGTLGFAGNTQEFKITKIA